ncbi:S-layer homology domain-containing protein [Megasphaera stantonii]|uniref:S-layer homology domain-containing protein n=1 Tax=Megasphaera stantonii TaxID=2144175 RepID=UPI001D40C149|nr:S-layer homology domain-containing protein [Megasphaera stantonii]HJE82985.1 S-layer homology domain-containing protein [Megasphaera stantonii]
MKMSKKARSTAAILAVMALTTTCVYATESDNGSKGYWGWKGDTVTTIDENGIKTDHSYIDDTNTQHTDTVFSVDETGNVEGANGTFTGEVSGATGKFEGDLSAGTVIADGGFIGGVGMQNGQLVSDEIYAANGTFNVDETGNVEGTNGTFTGEVSGATGKFEGDLSAGTVIADGGFIGGVGMENGQLVSDEIYAANGTFNVDAAGNVEGVNGSFSGNVEAGSIHAGNSLIGNVGLENGHVIAQDGIYAGEQNQFHVDNQGNVSTEGLVEAGSIHAGNSLIGNVGLENGHVIAQDGIYAGSQNQFHVDNAGNVSTEGDISGANGTFTGKVSGEAGSFNSVTANQAAFGRVDVAGDATVSGNLDVGSLTINGSELADVATVDDVKAQIGYDKTTNKYAEITATNAEGKKAETLTEAVNTNNSMIHENAVAIQNNSNAISSLGNRVSDLGDEIDNVGAISAALAGLHPLDYDGTGSKFQISAAVGTYDGSQAAALGAFYHFNRDVMLSLGGATAFDGDQKTAANLGVTFRIGEGASGKAVSDDVMARLEAMDQKIAALEQENKDLKNVLGAIDTSLSKEFPDVPANHWAYEAVTKLAGNDVVAGYPDGEFHGDRTMTRYEMAEVIYKAMQKGAKVDQKLVNEFKPEMEQVAANQNA